MPWCAAINVILALIAVLLVVLIRYDYEKVKKELFELDKSLDDLIQRILHKNRN